MSEHQFSIDLEVVVVPKVVQLEDEVVYLYRDGRLLRCGTVGCILGHLDTVDSEGERTDTRVSTYLVREHFDGTWEYGNKGPHVIQAGGLS